MSDKPTNDDVILELLEQYKNTNARLEKDLRKKRRPIFDFAAPIEFITKVIDGEFFFVFFVLFIISAAAFGVYLIDNVSGPVGQFYVKFDGIKHYQSELRCLSPSKPLPHDCYKVAQKIIFSSDTYVTSCIKSKDEAHKTAIEFREQWSRLND